jgi:hypothetical protein
MWPRRSLSFSVFVAGNEPALIRHLGAITRSTIEGGVIAISPSRVGETRTS